MARMTMMMVLTMLHLWCDCHPSNQQDTIGHCKCATSCHIILFHGTPGPSGTCLKTFSCEHRNHKLHDTNTGYIYLTLILRMVLQDHVLIFSCHMKKPGLTCKPGKTVLSCIFARNIFSRDKQKCNAAISDHSRCHRQAHVGAFEVAREPF